MKGEQKSGELQLSELEMLLAQEESNLTELGQETLKQLKQELQHGED